MAKKPAETVEVKPEVPKINKSKAVNEALDVLGSSATHAQVVEHLAAKGIHDEIASSLVSVLKKKKFGAGALRQRGDNSSSTRATNGEATISDLKRARDFANGLKLAPHELLELVSKINAFGDLEVLETCLKTLEELTG